MGQEDRSCGWAVLANIGKTNSGVVGVTGLWADESAYWPIAFEHYTPAHHFERGKQDPNLRTKLKIGIDPLSRTDQS